MGSVNNSFLMSFSCTAFRSVAALQPFPFSLAEDGQCIILPGFWGKRHSSSLPKTDLSSGLASLLRDQMRALGVLVLRRAMPPDSHLSNNATFLWHRDQNRDKNHRMKTELEDPGPKFFGHIHAENLVCNRLLVPGWTSWGDLSECALALVGAGTQTPQCVPLLRWQEMPKVCICCGNSEQGWWYGTFLLARLKTTDTEFLPGHSWISVQPPFSFLLTS